MIECVATGGSKHDQRQRQRRTPARTLLTACAVFAWPDAAAAAPSPDASVGAATSSNDCSARSANASPTDSERRAPRPLAEADVAELFAQYQCWVRRGNYPAAIAALERACEGADDAACSFNRAFVHHAWLAEPGELDQQHCSVARQNYASYLAREPYEEQSDAARSAIAELDRICAPEPPAPAVTLEPARDVIPPLEGHAPPPRLVTAPISKPSLAPAEPPSVPERSDLVPWLLIGTGSASALVAAVAWIDMTRADADLMHHRQPDGSVYPSTEARARDASRHRYQTLVWGFGSSAALLIGAGTTLLWLDPTLAPGVNLSIAPDAALLTYDRAF